MSLREDKVTSALETFKRCPLGAYLGLEPVEAARARAVVRLAPQPHHLNSVGRVHGAVLSALADQAAALAANTISNGALVLENKINFLAGTPPGEVLTAEAAAVDLKRSLALWEVRITNPSGTLVAQAQALTYPGPARE